MAAAVPGGGVAGCVVAARLSKTLAGASNCSKRAMPGIIRGHTVAPIIYIAERGCELIDTSA